MLDIDSIPGDLLAGSNAALNLPRIAQADGTASPVPSAIGTATKVTGQVTIKHADGSQEALKDGAAIKVGDAISTGADGKVGLTFDDGSTFALGAKGHMSVDEMTLPSPQGLGGKESISVDSGSFSLASGAIAKAYPDAMVLKTPVASVGIRGTTVAGQAAPEGSANTISLLPDADGTVGQVSVSTQTGTQVLSQPGATTQMTSAFTPPPPPVILSPQQIQQQYGDTLQTLPPPPSPEQLQQLQQQRQADAQTEAEQQAEAAANEQADGEQAATEGAANEQAQSEAEAAQDALGDALDAFFDSAFGDFGPAGDAFGDLINDLNALFASFDPLGDQGPGDFDLNELIAELGEDIAELIDEAIQDLIDDLEDEALRQDVNVFDLSVLGSTYPLETTDGETDFVIGTGSADTVTVDGSMGVGDTFVDYTSNDGDILTLAAGTENVGWRVAGVETIDLQHTTGPNTFIIGNDGATSITVSAGVDSISSSVVSQAPDLLVTGDQQWTITGNLGNDYLNMGDDNNADKLYLVTSGTHSATLNGVEEVYMIAGSPIDLTLNVNTAGMSLSGTAGADSLTLADGGNSVSVTGIETITGGSGNDSVTLTGTGTNTVKVTDIEVLTGNASATDIITSNFDALDVSAMTLSSIEMLRVDDDNNGAANSVTVLGSQLGAGKITTITFGTGTGIEKTLEISGGGTVNMSTVTLANFDPANSTTKIELLSATVFTGTTGGDVIQGSSAADNITGGQGDDTLTGGGGLDQLSGGIGNDVFRYTASTEFGDTIDNLDFSNGSGDKFAFTSTAAGGLTSITAGDFATTTNMGGFTFNGEHFVFAQTIANGAGALWFSANGTGSDMVEVAEFSTTSGTMTEQDITIVT